MSGTNTRATQEARRLRMIEFASRCTGTNVNHDGCSVMFQGWRDYYLKALTGAPQACVLCANGQGRFTFGDIKFENQNLHHHATHTPTEP